MMEVGVTIGFYSLAVVTVVAALAVVLLRNIFRAALCLVLCFVGVAGVYITLNADFLAAVQILMYAGAIAVLLIFGIMLTREAQHGNPPSRLQPYALLVAILMLAVFAFVVLRTDWQLATEAPLEETTGAIADAIFVKFVLPFETASVLLLAAIIGAIVLVRER